LPPADPPFASPTSVEAAVEELSADGAVAVAGGTSVGLLLKTGLLTPDRLVSLRRVPQLSAIALRDGELRLGAMVSLRTLIASPLVRATVPVLADAASQVGNPRVRAAATVGGAIAHADPRQDIPPVLLALGAYACLSGPASASRSRPRSPATARWPPRGSRWGAWARPRCSPPALLTGLPGAGPTATRSRPPPGTPRPR
jgi:carbon-monoxide dehydrogenase medium subunit